jgi:hypothetical protein
MRRSNLVAAVFHFFRHSAAFFLWPPAGGAAVRRLNSSTVRPSVACVLQTASFLSSAGFIAIAIAILRYNGKSQLVYVAR